MLDGKPHDWGGDTSAAKEVAPMKRGTQIQISEVVVSINSIKRLTSILVANTYTTRRTHCGLGDQ